MQTKVKEKGINVKKKEERKATVSKRRKNIEKENKIMRKLEEKNNCRDSNRKRVIYKVKEPQQEMKRNSNDDRVLRQTH